MKAKKIDDKRAAVWFLFPIIFFPIVFASIILTALAAAYAEADEWREDFVESWSSWINWWGEQ
jgi:hypothetical protein